MAGLCRPDQSAPTHDISHAANRRIHNLWQSAIPSRFIEELPKDQIEVTSEVSGYGGFGCIAASMMAPAMPEAPTIGGPGWQRFQKRRSEPKTMKGPPCQLASETFAPSDRCFHPKFQWVRSKPLMAII